MTNLTFRVGLVGSGNISETHARAVLDARGVALVAHSGRNAIAVQRQAQRFGGSAHLSVEAMLAAEQLDAILVGTPASTHAELATTAARRGVHVLIEKPLDVSTERIDELLGEAARAGVTIGVFFQDRSAPDLAWLKRQIDDGALGTPILASASVRWYRPPEYYAGAPWRGTIARDGGGALMSQGIHTVDLLLWFFGPVARVTAVAANAVHQIEVEDTIVCTLEFTSGALGTMEVTTAAFPGLPRRLELTGSAGTIVVEGDNVTSVALRTAPSSAPPGETGNSSASASSAVVSDVSGHRRIIEDFADAVRHHRAPMCDGHEGRRSVALIEAIYASARTGRAVEMNSLVQFNRP